MRKAVLAAAMIGAATLVSPAHAQVVQANFENGFGSFVPTGNVVIANGSTYQPCCGTSPSYTNKFAAFGGGDATSGFVTSLFSTTLGTLYNVTFRYGALGSGTETLTFIAGVTTRNFTATANNDLFSAFQAGSFTFTGTGAPMTLSILGGSKGGVDAILDDVSVAAVPEPATWGMMILGFGAMGYAMRRRAKVRTNVRFA